MCFRSQCLWHDGQHFEFSPLLPSKRIVSVYSLHECSRPRFPITVFGKHCECIAQKCTHLERHPSLNSHLLLQSHSVLTRPRGQKKFLPGVCMLPPEFETGSAGVVIQASAIYAMRTVVPDGSHCTRNQNADLFELSITISRTGRKNWTLNMTNSLFTCYLNCMCTFNLVCLI